MTAWAAEPAEFTCPNCGFSNAQMRDAQKRNEIIAALQVEREGFERKGDKKGVAEVDAQIVYYSNEATA